MSLVSSERRLVTGTVSVQLGADPEVFLARGNRVVGSELYIPEQGLSIGEAGKVVRDGVQVELHPVPSTCRESFAYYLGHCLTGLAAEIAERSNEEIGVSFRQVVNISKAELDKLSDLSRRLMCDPSFNAYRNRTVNVKDNFRMRSAAGHLHFGIGKAHRIIREEDEAKLTAKVFDCLIGLACILLDRDPNAARRRKLYGRAGEYRTPPHGFEYRVPSNFWLRSNALLSLMFGLGRMAIDVRNSLYYTRSYPSSGMVETDFTKELLGAVDLKKVEKAINTNDFQLAKEQWTGVAQFIDTYVGGSYSGLSSGAPLRVFAEFADAVEAKGIETFFPDDPIDYWRKYLETSGSVKRTGAESTFRNGSWLDSQLKKA